MSHYERRLEADIASIRAEVLSIGAAAEKGVERSIRALLNDDDSEAYAVVLEDLPINRRVRALDKRCHGFVARHLPSAGPLRFISSVLRLNIALERIGDYAVSIARQATVLGTDLPLEVQRLLISMDEQARLMLRQSMTAFAEGDAGLARGTKSMAGTIDAGLHNAYNMLVAMGEEKGSSEVRDLFGLLTVFARLERVSDQAKNICEEAIFTATGATKPPKVYKVLFLERAHNNWGHLAEHMARKAFPGSGAYDSAGWAPASTLAPSLLPQAEQLGLELGEAQPQSVDDLFHPLADYHVIVCLGDSEGCPEIPFYTSLLKWTLPEDTQQAARELSAHIADLMQLMRGDDAP